jgi:hypothetical protein
MENPLNRDGVAHHDRRSSTPRKNGVSQLEETPPLSFLLLTVYF